METVYVNNIKFALREQSKVEEEVKYISVLAVSEITVTPRVQSSLIIKSFWGFSESYFQHTEQQVMPLLRMSKFGK